MRRFELSEGTSNKFWLVSIENDSLRIQFGKIGSNGQIQLKKLPDASAATEEAERLIREKTKKGYAELATSAKASAGTSTSTSTSSSTASSLLASRFVWTDEARAAAAAHAARLASIRNTPKVGEAAVTARLKASFSKLAASKSWTGAEWSEECAAHRDRIAATWAKGKPPKDFEPVHEAATAALADVDDQSVVVASWLQRAGMSGALRALAALWAFDAKRDVLTVTDPATHWEGTYNGAKNIVAMLRCEFETLGAPEKAAALDVASTDARVTTHAATAPSVVPAPAAPSRTSPARDAPVAAGSAPASSDPRAEGENPAPGRSPPPPSWPARR